jgi:hypothetical protein
MKSARQEYFEKFEIDRDNARIFEDIAIKKVEKHFGVQLAFRPEGRDECSTNHFDFKMSNGVEFEVKADYRSLTTGNFFIEFWGFDKPRGISITTAHYHIITDKTNYYMIKTKRIRELIENNNYYVYRMKNISGTKGYLVPKCHIIALSKVLE